jgi:hypothetical protein
MVVRSYHSLMFFNVKAVTPVQCATWLRVHQALVRSQPSSVPMLSSEVGGADAHVNSPNNALGGDRYGD